VEIVIFLIHIDYIICMLKSRRERVRYAIIYSVYEAIAFD